LAWQYGRIALDNETLQDAATEFARYSGVRIVVDPAVANRTVTGMFASDDPVGFAKAAASVLKLHVEVNDETVRIFS
jgi:transmembrane sensor